MVSANPSGGHDPRAHDVEDALARKREADRRYRARHVDSIREKNRQWKARNPEKVKQYRDRFREVHREQVRAENRERERARAARARTAAAAAERRRVKARERYAADPAVNLEYQRERRKMQRTADPTGYREAKKQRNKRWRDRHRDEQNAKLRAKHREDPEQKRAAAERYYATHGDLVRERRRAYYWANRERQLEKQREWRAREKRRREAGLPPRRVHRVAEREREANRLAAHDFFSRERTRDEVRAIRVDEARAALAEPAPTAEELARLARSHQRARVAFTIAVDDDPVRPVAASQSRTRLQQLEPRRAAEAARLDAIARAINDRLRIAPRRVTNARPAHAPSLTETDTSGGLSL